ncbi:hypothetical protein IPM19_00280 [bacterium]|nr:MAG: hypothetical protein IPM19_00280 [bacterium]
MNYDFYRKKLESALRQYAQQTGSLDFLPTVLNWLPAIIGLCKSNADNKKSAFRIGQTILDAGEVKIIAPACPDWSNKPGSEGLLKGLGDGISGLAKSQIGFLGNLISLGVPVKATIVYPDQDRSDPLLLTYSGTNQSNFVSKVISSANKTREVVKGYGWKSEIMTALIADLETKCREEESFILNSPQFENRLTTETLARMSFYQKIYPNITWEQAYARSIRKSSYFLVLGRYAKSRNCLISDFTPTDNPWYKETDTGVLYLNSN